MDGMIHMVYAEGFERPAYNEMADTVLYLLEKYDVVSRVYVDGSFPAFIHSLKRQIVSAEYSKDYDQLIKCMQHRSESRFTVERLFPKMRSYLLILQNSIETCLSMHRRC